MRGGTDGDLCVFWTGGKLGIVCLDSTEAIASIAVGTSIATPTQKDTTIFFMEITCCDVRKGSELAIFSEDSQ